MKRSCETLLADERVAAVRATRAGRPPLLFVVQNYLMQAWQSADEDDESTAVGETAYRWVLCLYWN